MQRKLCWRILVLGVLTLIALSCGNDGDDFAASSRVLVTPPTTVVPTTTMSTTTTTTTSPTTTTTTTTLAPPLELDDVPRVLRTTTDVIVPVLDRVRDGHLVRTPCQAVTVVTQGETDDRVHVVIDPGHGGFEPGAVTSDDIAEKDVNLEVSLLAEQLLEEQGFDVTLTRYTDIRIPLRTRVEIADRLGAALLVSVHHQGTNTNVPRSNVPGTEVYYQQDSAESKRFAGILVEESRKELGVHDIEWFAGVDAGATYRPHRDTGEDFYGMVRLPETPAVLAEMAFLGNTAEVDLMRTGELQIAERLMHYRKGAVQYDERSETVEDPREPMVTVVVPAKNDARFIRPCLRSIREQWYPALECVVVDDGSTDGTHEIAAEFAEKDDRFRVVSHPTTRGPSAARNSGLAASTAPYVTFLDADDFLYQHAIRRRLEALQQADSDRVVGSFCDWQPTAEYQGRDVPERPPAERLPCRLSTGNMRISQTSTNLRSCPDRCRTTRGKWRRVDGFSVPMRLRSPMSNSTMQIELRAWCLRDLNHRFELV